MRDAKAYRLRERALAWMIHLYFSAFANIARLSPARKALFGTVPVHIDAVRDSDLRLVGPDGAVLPQQRALLSWLSVRLSP